MPALGNPCKPRMLGNLFMMRVALRIDLSDGLISCVINSESSGSAMPANAIPDVLTPTIKVPVIAIKCPTCFDNFIRKTRLLCVYCVVTRYLKRLV